MKPFWILGIASLVFVVGCQPEARSEIGTHAGKAFESAKAAAKVAMDSAVTEAQKIDWKSTDAAREAARQKLIAAQNELANLQTPTALEKARLENVQNELQRVDAAGKMNALEQQMLDTINKANNLKATSLAEVEQQRVRLRETSQAFATLEQQYQDASRLYQQAVTASETLRQKWEQLTSLGGGL